MLPNSTEDILQDTKIAPVTHDARTNRNRATIFILFSFLGIGLYTAAIFRSRLPETHAQPIADVLAPTPLPPTGTFVDRLYGTLVFARDSQIHILGLPDRMEHTVQDASGSSSNQIDTSYPPIWSPDGKLIAFITKEKKISITEFDTGKYVATFSLPSDVTPATLVLSIDPANELLSISEPATPKRDATVRFYSFATQKEIGVYPRCSGTGVWLTSVGFATMCTVADSQSVVVIRFEPNSSVMTPLSRETASVKYRLIDEYMVGSLLLQRTQNGRADLVTLSIEGKLTPVPVSEYRPITDIQKIVDVNTALRQRIEKETNVGPVADVSISADNSFLIFETSQGLFAAKLDLKDDPYFLGKGSMPRVRPQ